MAIFSLHLTLMQFVPGAFANLSKNIVTFFAELVNKAPLGINVFDVLLTDDVLVILFEMDESEIQEEVNFVFTTPIIIGLVIIALGLLFVIGFVVKSAFVIWAERKTTSEIFKTCQEGLDKGLLNEEQFLECLKIGKREESDLLDKLLLIGGSVLIVGGGIFLLDFLKKQRS